MVKERDEFESMRESSQEKKHREGELREAGQAARDKCALSIRDQKAYRVGGNQAVLSTAGDVELASTRLESSSLLSPTSSGDGNEARRNLKASKRRRLTQRQSDVMERIEALAGLTSSAPEFESRRLDFEMERFAKEMELQRIRMDREFEIRRQQEEREGRAEERAMQELQLRIDSLANTRRENDRAYEIKRQQLKLAIDQSERTAKHAERQMDIKMEKIKLMMSQHMASQATQ